MAEDKEKTAPNLRKPFVAGVNLLFGFAVAALIIFLWLAGEVYRGEAIIFDETIRRSLRRFVAPGLTQAMIYVSFFGSRRFLIGGVIVFSIVFIALKWKRAIILLLCAMAGEAVLEVTLKLLFKRPRPAPFVEYPPLESYSFPSGHALAAFCFYGILVWLMRNRLNVRGLKFALVIASATLVLLIGASRIYLGVHFPSDVLAGFAAAYVWLFAVASTDYYLGKNNSQP